MTFMTEKLVAVVGAGVMGCDLALDLSSHNYSVVLKDLTDDLLKKAEQIIRQNYKFVRLMKRDFSFSVEDILSRIKFVTNYQDFPRAEIIIENISEDLADKHKVYSELKNV